MNDGNVDVNDVWHSHGMTRKTPARIAAATIAVLAVVGSSVLVAPPASAATCGRFGTLVEQTEGPYYTPNAPMRRNVTDARTVGTPLVLTGTVVDARCRPVAGATIDVWQADGNGRYDNSGFQLRGRQVTDAEGRYRLVTVIPGQYPGRTEHIHVKVTPRGGPTRTTQLYFPGSTENVQDGIFEPRMTVRVIRATPERMLARFSFVLPS